MSLYTKIGIAFVLSLLVASQGHCGEVAAAQKFKTSHQCQEIAVELGQMGEDDSYVMHYVGCDSDPYRTDGKVWGPLSGSCNARARLAYNRGYPLFSEKFNLYVGRDGGCVLFEDGAWARE